MRGIERRLQIMNQIQQSGAAEVSELAELYQVSTMTIRRDLAKLEEDGLIRMEYGGAVLNRGTLFEYNMAMKQCEHLEEKMAIAEVAETYIKDGDSIFRDAGTTVCELAKRLVKRKNIKIMTQSLLVANVLAGSDVDLVMCPGRFRATSMAFMGQLTDAFLSSFRIDKLFLGVEGVAAEAGVSVPNVRDGITKQNLVRRSNWAACVADSSKFGKSYHYNICELSQLDVLITDKGVGRQQEGLCEKETALVKA